VLLTVVCAVAGIIVSKEADAKVSNPNVSSTRPSKPSDVCLIMLIESSESFFFSPQTSYPKEDCPKPASFFGTATIVVGSFSVSLSNMDGPSSILESVKSLSVIPETVEAAAFAERSLRSKSFKTSGS
jgi:hypothetical protein